MGFDVHQIFTLRQNSILFLDQMYPHCCVSQCNLPKLYRWVFAPSPSNVFKLHAHAVLGWYVIPPSILSPSFPQTRIIATLLHRNNPCHSQPLILMPICFATAVFAGMCAGSVSPAVFVCGSFFLALFVKLAHPIPTGIIPRPIGIALGGYIRPTTTSHSSLLTTNTNIITIRR